MMFFKVPACAMLLILLGGCVQRTLTVRSDPPGALVYLNGREVGRTPVTRRFMWYGDYDVILRKEGYETLKTHSWVVAPIYQWPPIDLFAELLPLKDRQVLTYTLQPASTQPADTQELVSRAEEMKGMLRSGKYTVKNENPIKQDRDE